MMRRRPFVGSLFVSMFLLAACGEADTSPNEPGGDPNIEGDASVADGSRADGGTTPEFPGGEFPPGTRLLIGSEAGYVLSVSFSTDDALVEDSVIFEVGAPLKKLAIRPGTREVFAVTRREDEETATLHLLQLESDGTLTSLGTQGVQFVGIRDLRFDATGTWALLASDRRFWVARVGDDGRLGTATDLGECDAQTLVAGPANDVLLGLCGWDDHVRVYPFSVADGASESTSELRFDGVRPAFAETIAGSTIVVGSSENADGGRNRTAVIDAQANSAGGVVVLRAPWLDELPRPMTTALTRHPTLPVAYALHGYSTQYHGYHLSVLGVNGMTVEVQQYVSTFADSYEVGITPDGRWLLVGSHRASEVRAHRIDATGNLGEERVSILIDSPIFIDFL